MNSGVSVKLLLPRSLTVNTVFLSILFLVALPLATQARAQSTIIFENYGCRCTTEYCKPFESYRLEERYHVVTKGETLSDILFQYGIGNMTAPFCLYRSQHKSWMDYIKQINPQVKNWRAVAEGTTLKLEIPVVVEAPQTVETLDTSKEATEQVQADTPPPELIHDADVHWSTKIAFQQAVRSNIVLVGQTSEYYLSASKKVLHPILYRLNEFGVEVSLRPKVQDHVLDTSLDFEERHLFLFSSVDAWDIQHWHLLTLGAVGISYLKGHLPDQDNTGQLLVNNIDYSYRPTLKFGLLPTYAEDNWEIQGVLIAERVFGTQGFSMNRGKIGVSYRRQIYQNQNSPKISLGVSSTLESTVIVGKPDYTDDHNSDAAGQDVVSSYYLPFLGLELGFKF